MFIKILFASLFLCATAGFAHNSYTGGYSGAPGRSSCASSCHGGTAGTLVVTGFPSVYQPLQVYSIVVKHNGGSKIVNFNATTRIGSGASVAGTFANGANCTSYSGADGGVYASPHLIDSAVILWTAPAAGSGTINFYAAGFQGTTSSSNGQSSKVTLTTTESTTGVQSLDNSPTDFSLSQNYPNPFNPTTTIRFEIPRAVFVRLSVLNLIGQEVAVALNDMQPAGSHQIQFDGNGLASGVYFYRLEAGTFVDTKKFVLLR
ncbi:MAG: T9SS type A sorting domain-containing protein [bacterium]